HRGIRSAQGLNASETRRTAELQVDHGIARLITRQHRLHCVRVRCSANLIAPALERTFERPREGLVIFDNQQAPLVRHDASPSGRAIAEIGSRMRTRAPPSSRLATLAPPPSLRRTLTSRNNPSPPPGRPFVER